MGTFGEAHADDTYLGELCIGWPRGLHLLLKAGYRLDTQELLVYALHFGYLESVVVLLNDGNPAIHGTHLWVASRSSNTEAFELVARALAERRRKLQKLAERHLPPSICESLGLPINCALDSRATLVFSTLQDHGIPIDPSLFLDQLWDGDTVYNVSYDRRSAEILFNAGFQDFEEGEIGMEQTQEDFEEGEIGMEQNEEDFEEGEIGMQQNQGMSTLMRVADPDSYPFYTSLHNTLKVMGFLISKGANPHRQRVEDRQTASHILGSWLSHSLRESVVFELRNMNSLTVYQPIARANSSQVRAAVFEVFRTLRSEIDRETGDILKDFFLSYHCDSCSCACSENGCFPSTMFFRELITWTDSPPNIQALAETIRFLSEQRRVGSVEAFHDTIAPTVLRVCIFEHLELTHTCCKEIPHAFFGKPKLADIMEDFLHIRDEQRYLIEEVDNLTDFFLSKYREIGLGLPEFLLEYWSIEIQKVPAPDPQEVEAIKRVGVILDE
ncbi:hypothetical protein N7468_000580 [Penicillium chermesinum]|uniref:Uncharacterized protein n=1 Tax=Penicillium chermesinum TaxID=63820 RepID=A0A9W9PNK8_9EURO|nr:uncharacterized protein N7468_000580 [Penicillium chermesinum]KAJ5249129.1 hypothetical protein N7468_000580 [Penicillium chermesinum]